MSGLRGGNDAIAARVTFNAAGLAGLTASTVQGALEECDALIDAVSGGSDADAIHDNVSNEIALITEETSPASTDLLIMELAGGGAKRRVQMQNLPAGGETNDLETVTFGIATDELVMGTGAGVSTYQKISVLSEEATPATGDWVLGETAAGALVKMDPDNIGGGGGSHELLSATHTDTLAASAVRGDLVIANATPAWARVAVGAAGTYLQGGALDPSYAALDVTDDAAISGFTGSGTTVVRDTSPTLATPTLTNPVIVTGGGITNAASVPYLQFTEVGSAVVRFQMSQQTTGNYCVLAAVGEANAKMRITGSGVGTVQIADPEIAAGDWANANHTHAGASTGGQIATSNLSGTIAHTQIADFVPQSILLRETGTGAPSDTIFTELSIVSADATMWVLGWDAAGIIARFDANDFLAAGSAHDILSTSHDAVTATVVRGDLMIGNATPLWDRLAAGGTGTYLKGGTDPAYGSLDLTDASQVTGLTGTSPGLLVLQTSPTIITPVIASFTTAQHDHSDAAGGGALGAGSIAHTALANFVAESILLREAGTGAPTASIFTDIAIPGTASAADWVLGWTSAGVIARWDANDFLAAGGSHDILSTSHDAVTATVVRGDLMIGNASPLWDRLAVGGAGTYLQGGALDPSYAALDVTDDAAISGFTGTGTTVVRNASPTIVTPTIASMANAQHNHADAAGGGVLGGSVVANSMLADMSQALIKGRALSAGTGAPQDLTATQARAVLNVADNADVTDEASVTAALPVIDSTTLVKGSVTAGKLMRIEVDGFAGAVTRVLTMADQNIDLTPGTGSFATEAEGTLAASAVQDGGDLSAGSVAHTAIANFVPESILLREAGTGAPSDSIFTDIAIPGTAGAADWVLGWTAAGLIARWDANDFLAAGGAHDILSTSHDAVTATVVRGDLMIGNATPLWDRLAVGGAGTYLQGGTDPSYAALDVTDDAAISGFSGTGTTLVRANDATIVDALMTGLTVASTTGIYNTDGILMAQFNSLGAPAVNWLQVRQSITGNPVDFLAVGDGTDTNINMRLSGSGTGTVIILDPEIGATDFTDMNHTHASADTGGQIAIASTTGTLGETRGGTDQTTYAQGDFLYATAANQLGRRAIGTARQVLRTNSAATAPEWHSPMISRPVTIANPDPAIDDRIIMWTQVAITINEVRSIIQGTTNIVFNIRHGTDRSAAGATVFTSDITQANNTTGSSNSSGFSDNTIPANEWVWLDIVSRSGTPTEFHATIEYTED